MKYSLGSKTIAYPLPVFMVSSYDKQNAPNMMAASWGGICCSKPPLITISIQPKRYSFDSIMHSKAYVVNIPSSRYVKEADYCGIFSGKNENKFDSTGLTAIKSENVNAPVVLEFPFNIECELFKTVELGTHTQFIGEIKNILCDEDALDFEKKPDINKIEAIIYDYASRAYYSTGQKISDAYLKHK